MFRLLAKRTVKAFRRPKFDPFLIAPATQPRIDPPASFFADPPSHETDSFAIPTIISYGTRDRVYDKYLERLRSSCDAANQPVSFETIPKCSRRNACLFKPTFIKFKLLTLGSPIVWLDADAYLHQQIRLPIGDWDVGTIDNTRADKLNPKAALFIAFQPSVKALRFLELWEQFCSAHWLEPRGDHRRLSYARFVLANAYSEIDLTSIISGCLTRDLGTHKEQNI